MKKKIRKIAMVLLFAVFVVSTGLAVHQMLDNAGGEDAYAQAMAIAAKAPEKTGAAEATVPAATEAPEPVKVWIPATVEDDPELERMKEISLAALREVNPEVIGWIRIPGTKVDYPLMQGEDNDFYLKHTWQKERNSVGSIFMEYQNSADLTDYNTIVYGHNMKNDSMFGTLDRYARSAWWQANPYVYLLTDAGVYRYEIFAFFRPEVDSLTYGMKLQRDDTKQDFLNQSLELAWYDTGIVPPVTDRILTLSTCSGGGYSHRYVVQARLPMVEVVK